MNVVLAKEPPYPVFQPLVHLATGHFFGYEALLRSSTQHSPEFLFRKAREEGHLFEWDTMSMKKAIESYFTNVTFNDHAPYLFINVFPSTLVNPAFLSFVTEGLFGSWNRRIVLEINETNEEDKMWELRLLGKKIRELRQHGFLIALDDVGSGAASLKKIVEYEPDIVKLDRYFGNQLSSMPNKQKLVSLFVQYCQDHIQLVLEGIEEPEDLAVALALGVPVGQGFLLGYPEPLQATQKRR
ncbi:EAL domain-containing protein [Brevibacillus sp. M2.1A]|uniref:EAL domain-containing protein n=1 Tax=Brevibacillus TaxID=55080 RepID=UPI00156B00B1|nr:MULTISPECIES: EAL domain-containing protein [Brevibacillus]MBY0087468.1 EAL domain-containing protein [Brevibacillus brevis]MCC8436517.1 EAL domain-containing protein [Brevibacillus sp. M2.1A]UKK98713.1 EAL domain-containing protein [Brevibacillus brevis]